MYVRSKCLLSGIVFLCCASQAFAFGAPGHRLVGAVADLRLKGTATAAKVNALLAGMTLEDVATVADSIRDWDPPHRPPGEPGFTPLLQDAQLEKDLERFFLANRAGRPPRHHDFHFTDVPVQGNSKYASGPVGRSDHDVVHMIPFCAEVLKGDRPENNQHMISKRVAVMLLTHYLGDLHQPLHVGAEYFDQQGKPVNPDEGQMALTDRGGNNLLLAIFSAGSGHHTEKLHTYWDDDAVVTAVNLQRSELVPQGIAHASRQQIIESWAKHPPAGWQVPANASIPNLVIDWADEILPDAREAHARLKFEISSIRDGAAFGTASEVVPPGGYPDFAGKVIQKKIPLAGARLAALLERLLN